MGIGYLLTTFSQIALQVRQKEEGKTQEYLSYDENVSSSSSYCKVVLDDHLFSLKDEFELLDYLATFNTKKGKYCINKVNFFYFLRIALIVNCVHESKILGVN